MTEYILQVTDIHKHFGGVHALKGVSLDIRKGEIYCLAGENGCGKSTLIKIISGFYQADSGKIFFNGSLQNTITPQSAIAAGIQVIYQDFSIFPNLTVYENLALNTELMAKRKIVNKQRLKAIAKKAIAQIDFSIDLEETLGNLSVADKQLVAISRALLDDAQLIIMDEPTTALTKKEVESLFKIIKQLQSKGIAILFVSHKMDEVFEISERFSIFRNGESIMTGNTAELDNAQFSYYMTGREFKNIPHQKKEHGTQPVFECKNISHKTAFKNISFALHKGEVLGITGLLGSGRTELVECLFGAETISEGLFIMNGKPVKIRSIKDAIRLGIGYVPEDRLTEGLFLPQSIKDNITIAKLDLLSKKIFGVIDTVKIDEQSAHWIKTLGIKTNNDQNPVQTLSGGNQQKVVLAKWLALNLHILLLNCPTAGVDIGAKYDIHTFIRQMADDGLSVIVISDDLPEVIALCDRVLIMKAGAITAEYTTENMSERELSQVTMHDEVF
ncbi:sugar ABC transporter ATP-binding protein [Treponema phagedenis]|nr:sugar ABC transporter ATP-binding protein [Treponema phagedenis]QEJ96338.1 sugar ABC transporter ATP-binding protein [Treponema phagedenis]QEK02136.1 sugar ABC transporter ATP-binding protein [Treponema phagedenis]QEK07389.1 sugar ABC transporter ATP-binding protein [Treponema phagedenis]QSH94718.1 sugar ABC transporter ATP-binding protein [Treponema phagedenis]